MMLVTVEFSLRPGTETEFQKALDQAHASLKKHDGFLGEEPCQSLLDPNKFVSVFYFRDRGAIRAWREDPDHLQLQEAGKERIFSWYRIRIAEIKRQYSFNESVGSGLATRDL